jgi:hypothetical protein
MDIYIYVFLISLISVLERAEWSASLPRRFISGERSPLPQQKLLLYEKADRHCVVVI